MGKRGKRSAADLAVVSADSKVTAVSRPGAPPELDDEQAYEWLLVVNRMPADWFSQDDRTLVAYCRHVVCGRHVASLIAELEKGETIDVPEYDRLLKMQERESRGMSALATRMRLTQQSTIDRERKKPALMRKPWEEEE